MVMLAAVERHDELRFFARRSRWGAEARPDKKQQVQSGECGGVQLLE